MANQAYEYEDATGIDDPRIENLQKLVAVQKERLAEQRQQMEFYTSLHLWDLLLTAIIFGGVGVVAGTAFACWW